MKTQFSHLLHDPDREWAPLHAALADAPMRELWAVWKMLRDEQGQAVGSTTRDPALATRAAIARTIPNYCAHLRSWSSESRDCWDTATRIGRAFPNLADSILLAFNTASCKPIPEPNMLNLKPPAQPAADLQAAVAALSAALSAANTVPLDQAGVAAIVDDKLATHTAAAFAGIDDRIAAALAAAIMPTRITVDRGPDLPPIELGTVHMRFPVLLRRMTACRLDGFPINQWLFGPPGTGKTSAAKAAAAALGLTFYTTSAVDGKHEFMGFTDANGRIVNTAFRQAWITGGVFLADELDASFPAAVMALNTALANNFAQFPGDAEPTPRHVDCHILVGANSKGLGGDVTATTATRFAFSTLDRFVYLDWPIDEVFEMALATCKPWCKRVQAARFWLASANIRGVLITPRSTFKGCALLAALDATTAAGLAELDRATWAFALNDDQYRNAAATLPTFEAAA